MKHVVVVKFHAAIFVEKKEEDVVNMANVVEEAKAYLNSLDDETFRKMIRIDDDYTSVSKF